MLEQFAATTLSVVLEFEQIEPMIRVCEMHGTELIPDTARLATRCRGWANDFTQAMEEWFPNIDCGPLVMGNPFDNYRYGLWRCPSCRAAETEWRKRNACS